ncbi:hypothetical protein [Nocardia altamirensis]|uniref:hypothetical protein n=1 Tax=Nocardia altamirensis TaxID=472158 RepID=UPI00114CCB3A|nr:hypothetical protein [Nocardia altamirensis]
MTDRTSGMRGRVGVVVGVFGVAAAATVCVVPTAGAVATQVSIHPGLNVGSSTNYGTGCTYQARAAVTDVVQPVAFYDNGVRFAVVAPSGGTALVNWVPATEGPHTISAVQSPDFSIVASMDVHVGRGVHVAEGCNVFGG